MKKQDLSNKESEVTKNIWSVLESTNISDQGKNEIYKLLHDLRCVSKKQAYLEISNKAQSLISFTN